MIVTVTGSSGFIGSNLVKSLIKRGHKVHEYDIKQGNDVLAPDYKNSDVIAHLAGLIDVKESFDKPYDYLLTNAISTALLPRDKRVVLASSAAVYGEYSPYGMSKKLAETTLNSNSVALRIFNPFGENENHEPETHVIPLLLKGGATIYQNGEMRRSFIHVDDVVSAFIEAIEKSFTGTYDVCADYSLSVKEVAELLNIDDITFVPKTRDSGDTHILHGNNKPLKKVSDWHISKDPKQALRNMRHK